MSVRRWVVIAVLVAGFFLLYAPTQSVSVLQQVRESADQFLHGLGLVNR